MKDKIDKLKFNLRSNSNYGVDKEVEFHRGSRLGSRELMVQQG